PDLERMFAGRVAQDDLVRFDARGGVGVTHAVDAGFEIERDGVAHDGEVLVVDGQGWFGAEDCLRHQTGQTGDGDDFFHGFFAFFFINTEAGRWLSYQCKSLVNKSSVLPG